MSERPPHRHPHLFRLYYGTVVALAMALLVQAGGGASVPPLPWVVGIGLIVAICEAMPVPLPGGGQATSGTIFLLPCLLILGPFWTAIIDMAVVVVAQGLIGRRPLIRILHNMGISTVMHFAAGAVFVAGGGTYGSIQLPRDAWPMLLAGAAFFVTNSSLVSIVVGLTAGPDPWRVWQRSFLEGLHYHLSFVALGFLVAVLFTSAGPWSLVLFAMPFLVAQHSFRTHVELRSDLKDFVRALTKVLEEVDPYTRHHSVRVAEYSVRLARGMRRSEREVEEIEYAALVHDLGKIGPQHQHILQKPGSLSQEEQRTLRAHPGAGAEIVAKVRALSRAAEIVRSHHERPDGKGYPFGLRSADVPVGARILNVADAFDAMTSDRPYRRALPVDAALREIERGAGTQFDAEVVSRLLRMHAAGQFPLVPSPSSEDLQLLRLKTRPA